MFAIIEINIYELINWNKWLKTYIVEINIYDLINRNKRLKTYIENRIYDLKFTKITNNRKMMKIANSSIFKLVYYFYNWSTGIRIALCRREVVAIRNFILLSCGGPK